MMETLSETFGSWLSVEGVLIPHSRANGSLSTRGLPTVVTALSVLVGSISGDGWYLGRDGPTILALETSAPERNDC